MFKTVKLTIIYLPSVTICNNATPMAECVKCVFLIIIYNLT